MPIAAQGNRKEKQLPKIWTKRHLWEPNSDDDEDDDGDNDEDDDHEDDDDDNEG